MLQCTSRHTKTLVLFCTDVGPQGTISSKAVSQNATALRWSQQQTLLLVVSWYI